VGFVKNIGVPDLRAPPLVCIEIEPTQLSSE
jgi:hypothetical protein